MKRLIYTVLVALLAVSCMGIQETDPSAYMRPNTSGVNISQQNNTLYVTLTATASGADRVESCGFYCGKSSDLAGAERISSTVSESFSASVLLKEYGTDYYVCSFVANAHDELRSDVKTLSVGSLSQYVKFTGNSLDSYKVSTLDASLSVNFSAHEGVNVSEMGVCYGENNSLSIDNKYVTAARDGKGYFSVTIPDLLPGKQYYIRPYIKDGAHIAYADVSKLNVYSVPEVKTLEVKDIADRSARLCGEVTDDCGKTIADRGFVWAEGNVNPDLNSSKVSVSGKIGAYEQTVSNLVPNTLYSVRAYAVNSEGVSYGEVQTFTTKPALAVVLTDKVSDVSSTSAMVYAKVTDKGGEEPSEFGILLGTSSEVNPDNAEKIKASGSSAQFSVSLKGLARKTKYYVKAYVTNSVGTSYGKVLEFETNAELPVVATLPVEEITDVSAVTGGNITDDGGDVVKARGVVWGTSENPTIDNASKTSDGTGKGQYTSTIIKLKYETVYYVRAYATNSVGTSYGETIKFTTTERDLSRAFDLSEDGTANSYIVSESGMYMIPAVKGNSTESVGNVASVEVLWESFGTIEWPSVGTLVSETSYSGAYIVFQVPAPFHEGNAVIAAKDSSGKILWSWHIWLTDQPKEQVYYNNAGTMMDRNLGAVSATPGDVGALGLLYQWGRKDPFLGSASINSRYDAASTGEWTFQSYSTAQTGTIAYSIENPMTFIYNTELNEDWFYTGSTAVDNTRWQSEKTIYDPCPAGWRVPDGGNNGIWSKAAGSEIGSYDYNKKGMDFSGVYGSDSIIWYPAAGYRGPGAELYQVGEYATNLSVTPYDSTSPYVYVMKYDFRTNEKIYFSATMMFRTGGSSVRCMKIETNVSGGTEGVGGSDYEW